MCRGVSNYWGCVLASDAQTTTLDLSGAALHHVHEGISRFRSLQKLYLHNNRLRTLPASLGQLTLLTLLSLHHNDLVALPTQVGQLIALEKLYLDNNRLTALPTEMANLGNLTHLFLHRNRMESVLPVLSTIVTSRAESLSLSMHDNPSVCAAAVSPSASNRRELVCDCALGFTGTDSCRPIHSSLLLDQAFASTRGTSTFYWPKALEPRLRSSGGSGKIIVDTAPTCGVDTAGASMPSALTAAIVAEGPETTALTIKVRYERACETAANPDLDVPQTVSATPFEYAEELRLMDVSGFRVVWSVIDGTYVRQDTPYGARPWYYKSGNPKWYIYWYNDAGAWYVSRQLGATAIFGRAFANVATPDLVPTSSWQAYYSGRGWIPINSANPGVFARSVFSIPEIHTLLVNSAFQHTDDFPSANTPALRAEPGRPHRYPISKEVMMLPHVVQANPHLPAVITFRVVAAKRWIIDVGGSDGETSKRVELPQDGLVVYPVPVNWQVPEWETERFATSVVGSTLTVNRTDDDGDGWEQPLQLEAVSSECHASLSSVAVEPEADRNEAILAVSSPVAIDPDACPLRLVAREALTLEEMHITDFSVNVTDCHDRCENGGECVDLSGSQYDGNSSCMCAPGFTGDTCEQEAFVVTWPGVSDILPTQVFGIKYSRAPRPTRVEATMPVSHYSATNLPCGMTVDPTNGHLGGTPVQPGKYSIVVQAHRQGDSNAAVPVNGKPFRLTLKECDNSLTCNGGKCRSGNKLYDGQFTCNCLRTGKTGTRCDQEIVEEFVVEWVGHSRAWQQATLQQAYLAAPPSQVRVSPHNESGVRYTAAGLPCGMEVDPATGGVTGAPGSSGNFEGITIFAEYNGHTAKVNQEEFSLEVTDCDGNLTCTGGRCIDTVAYDGLFECDCSELGDHSGKDCSIVLEGLATSLESNDDTAVPIVAGALGGTFGLLVILLVVWFRRSAREKPYDFDAVLAQMQEDGVVGQQGEVKTPRELPRKSVTLLEELGAGQFGEVSGNAVTVPSPVVRDAPSPVPTPVPSPVIRDAPTALYVFACCPRVPIAP